MNTTAVVIAVFVVGIAGVCIIYWPYFREDLAELRRYFKGS